MYGRRGNEDSGWYRRNLAAEFVYVTHEWNIRTFDQLIAVNKLSKNGEYRLIGVQGTRYGDVVLTFGRYVGNGELDLSVSSTAELRTMYSRACGEGIELAFSGSWIERGRTTPMPPPAPYGSSLNPRSERARTR